MVITTEYTFILKRFDDCLSQLTYFYIYIYIYIYIYMSLMKIRKTRGPRTLP